MRKYSEISKRIQATVLALAMILSTLSVGLVFGASAADEPTKEKTDGNLVAENYELTESEEKLLNSGYLIGATHNYTVPDASDDLIKVNTENKTVTAETYEGESGYVWNPVSAEIKVGDEVKETIKFTDGKATYTYGGDAFAVVVKYDMKLTVDKATQETLMKAPALLKEGIENIDVISAADGMLDLVVAMKQVFEMLVDDGLSMSIGGGSATLSFNKNEFQGMGFSENDAAKAILAQAEANGGKLDLQVMIEEYNASASKTEYLAKNGTAIKAKLQETFNYMLAISYVDTANAMNSSVLRNSTLQFYLNINDPDTLNALNLFNSNVDKWKEAVDDIVSDDAWGITTTKVLRNGLTPAEYLAIDAMLIGLETSDLSGIRVKEILLADTTTVQFNMSMYDVTVKVVLMTADGVVGSAGLKEYATVTEVITFAEKATKSDMLAKITEKLIEKNALTSWASVYVEGKFTRTETTDLPASLTKDVEYVITYAPVVCTVDYAYQADAQLPYGAKIHLPVAEKATEAYDYKINGEYYAQDSVYTVTENVTISREIGKSYTTYTKNQLAALNYFAGNAKASGILNSGALLVGNEEINVRVPDVNDGLVSLSGTTLKALDFGASYEGLTWKPYSYKVVTGNTSKTYYFSGNNATITEADFDRIEVTYRLTLTNISTSEVGSLVSLPATLADEAADQLSVLNRLNGYSEQLKQADKTLFTLLKTIISEDDSMSPAVKKSLEKAINGIINDCIADNKLLKIANTIGEYDKEGLKYYYLNSKKVIDEIDTLCDYFSLLLDEEEGIAPGEKKEALKSLIRGMGDKYADYADKVDDLDDLKAKIENIRNDLKSPNAAIDLESENLGKLCDVLTNSGSAANSLPINNLYIDSSAITVNANGKVTVGATINVGNQSVTIDSITFAKNHNILTAEAKDIIARINAAIASLGINDKYYTTDYNEDIIWLLVGQDVSTLETTHFVFTWTPKTYKVNVEGMAQQTISVNDLEIDLAAGDAQTRYEYVIDGKKVSTSTYKFTLDQIDRLFVKGECSIERNEVDVREENLLNFVNDLNTAMGSNDVVLALTKNGNDYAVVMKIASYNPGAIMAPMQKLATALMTQGYSYVAFDDSAFVYTDNNNNMKISLQAIIDAVMGSGFGTQTIIDLVNANGSINNMKMPGEVISDKKMTVAGGKLAESSLVLGDSANDVDFDVPLYITLGSAPSELTQIRNLLADKMAPYFSFYCEEGKATMDVTMPKKAYEACLAILLMTDNVDFADINNLSEDIALSFMMDIFHPLMNSDASAESVSNTLKKFGFDIDFTQYNEAFEAIREFYKAHYAEDGAYKNGITVNLGIGQYIDELDLGTLSNMIAEKDTGITFSFEANIKNFDRNYEALFFDVKAEGITNKFGLVENLSTKLGEMSGTAIVILLSDVNSNLTFNTRTILNLNGFAVNGNVTGNASVRVIDSMLDDDTFGTITGAIDGGVILAGGKYAKDVTSFIPEGYEQAADGEVRNEFMNIYKDSEGNINVKLNASMFAGRKLPDLKTLAADMIVELVMNGYSANKLYVEGYQVLELVVDDLIGLYAASNRTQAILDRALEMASPSDLVEIFKLILGDVTDLSNLIDVLEYDLENGTETPILSYGITTGSWGVTVGYVEDGDYVTGSVISGKSKDKNLNVIIVGEEGTRQHVADVLSIIYETTTVSAGVNSVVVEKNGKNVILGLGVSSDIRMDLSKDPKYAVMLGVIIADGLGAPKNEALVKGLKTYFEENNMDYLTRAFNKLTINNIIAAIRNVEKGDSFSAMLARLGLSGYDTADAVALEADLDVFIKVLAWALRKVEYVGDNYTVSDLINYDYSDSKYMAMLTAMIADGLEMADKETLVSALKTYLNNGRTEKLVSAFEDIKSATMIAGAGVVIAKGLASGEGVDLEAAIENYKSTGSTNKLIKAFNDLTPEKIVNAIVNRYNDSGFEAMLDRLGITGFDAKKLTALKGDIEEFANRIVNVVRKVESAGNNYTMASFIDMAEYTYKVEKHNVKRGGTVGLVGGYTLSASVEVVDFVYELKLFSEPAELLTPEFVDGHGAPTLSAVDSIFGAKIDTENKYIILDTIREGVTVAELAGILTLNAINHDGITVDIENVDGLVFNGAKLTAVAYSDEASATLEYTVIVLGDLSHDGENNIIDIVMMVGIIQSIVNETIEELDEIDYMAANVISTNGINVIDIVTIIRKIVNTDTYVSPLPALKA